MQNATLQIGGYELDVIVTENGELRLVVGKPNAEKDAFGFTPAICFDIAPDLTFTTGF